MLIRCVLFDLDGTLVDTAAELADALNGVLQRLKRVPVSEALVRTWVGEGTYVTLQRALAHAGVPPQEAARLWPAFEHDFLDRCGTHSSVYPHVRATLKRLAAMGVPLGLLTNKEAAFAHRVLVRHELSEFFDLLVTGDALPVRKPDPAVVRHALAALGAEADETLLVGDSAVDVRTARAAGVPVWLVAHGYAQEPLTGDLRPDRMIDRFDEIAEAAGKWAEARVSIS